MNLKNFGTQSVKMEKYEKRIKKTVRFEILKKFVNTGIKECNLAIEQKYMQMTKRLNVKSTKNFQVPFDDACKAIKQIMSIYRNNLLDAIQMLFGTKRQREARITMLIYKSYAKHAIENKQISKRKKGEKKYGVNNDQEFIDLAILRCNTIIQNVYDVLCCSMQGENQIQEAVRNHLINEKQQNLNEQQKVCIKKITNIICTYLNPINFNEEKEVEALIKKDQGEVSTGDFDKQLKEILAQEESVRGNSLGIMEFQVDSDMASICDAIKNDFDRAKQRLELDQHLFSFDQMEVYDYPIFLN